MGLETKPIPTPTSAAFLDHAVLRDLNCMKRRIISRTPRAPPSNVFEKSSANLQKIVVIDRITRPPMSASVSVLGRAGQTRKTHVGPTDWNKVIIGTYTLREPCYSEIQSNGIIPHIVSFYKREIQRYKI